MYTADVNQEFKKFVLKDHDTNEASNWCFGWVTFCFEMVRYRPIYLFHLCNDHAGLPWSIAALIRFEKDSINVDSSELRQYK